MTNEPLAAAPRLFAATEASLYRAQREALTDLLAFLDVHAPGTAAPLPVLVWRVASVGRMIMARLSPFGPDPSGIRAEPRRVLAAYAAVLGTQVRTVEMDSRTRHTVRGRIGRPPGVGQQPRTWLYLEADVWNAEIPQSNAGKPPEPVGTALAFTAV